MSTVRLRYLAKINPPTPEFDRAAPDAEVPFVPLEAVWPAGLDLSRTRPKHEVAQGYTRFREADILVPKITPTFEANRTTIAHRVCGGFGAGTTELHVVRCRHGVDPRYIRYLLASLPFLLGGEAELIGVAGQKRVPDSWLRDFTVPVVELERQQAIADFLDTETTRIDALFAKKRRLIDLLEQRSFAEIDAAASVAVGWSKRGIPAPRHIGWPIVRLGSVARVQTGLTLDSGRDVDSQVEAVPYLRVANVQDGTLDLSEVKLVQVPAALARRTALRPGDVLMTEGGDPDKLGRGAVWRGELEPCLHQNHVFAVRPDAGLRPDYLALISRTSYARAYFEVTASKTTGIASTSMAKIAAFRLALPPVEKQAEIVARWRSVNASVTSIVERLHRQIALLQEHRQALITAAVTGELDIPGVAA